MHFLYTCLIFVDMSYRHLASTRTYLKIIDKKMGSLITFYFRDSHKRKDRLKQFWWLHFSDLQKKTYRVSCFYLPFYVSRGQMAERMEILRIVLVRKSLDFLNVKTWTPLALPFYDSETEKINYFTINYDENWWKLFKICSFYIR